MDGHNLLALLTHISWAQKWSASTVTTQGLVSGASAYSAMTGVLSRLSAGGSEIPGSAE